MRKNIFIILLILVSTFSFGQKNVSENGVKMSNFTGSTFSYNFFTGTDATRFRTTPKALGSGVYDFSSSIPFNIWLYSPKNRNIGIGTGIALNFTKYRFVQPYYFDNQDRLVIDTNSNHIYRPDFFTRDGSKFVFMNLMVPGVVYFPVSKWFGDKKNRFGLMGMVFYKRLLSVYNKRFYIENGLLVKNKVPNSQINKYFNKDNFGFRAGFKFFIFYAWGEYTYTPFFNDYFNRYDLHETKVGFTIDFSTIIYKRLEKKFDLDDKNNDDGSSTDL